MSREPVSKAAVEALEDVRARADRCSRLVETHPALNEGGRLTAKASAYRHAAELFKAALPIHDAELKERLLGEEAAKAFHEGMLEAETTGAAGILSGLKHLVRYLDEATSLSLPCDCDPDGHVAEDCKRNGCREVRSLPQGPGKAARDAVIRTASRQVNGDFSLPQEDEDEIEIFSPSKASIEASRCTGKHQPTKEKQTTVGYDVTGLPSGPTTVLKENPEAPSKEKLALALLIERIERDLHEPDKLLCHLASARRQLADQESEWCEKAVTEASRAEAAEKRLAEVEGERDYARKDAYDQKQWAARQEEAATRESERATRAERRLSEARDEVIAEVREKLRAEVVALARQAEQAPNVTARTILLVQEEAVRQAADAALDSPGEQELAELRDAMDPCWKCGDEHFVWTGTPGVIGSRRIPCPVCQSGDSKGTLGEGQ